MKLRFGSVCSGIEAASVAWNPLGWEAAWFSEIEPFPCAVLQHHYPNVRNVGDMTKLPELILSGEVEAPDMLCGGSPCQSFSVAGKRCSLDDERGNLSLVFCEVANAIDAIRSVQRKQPSIIFWENVPGVLNTKDNAFGCFLGELVGADAPLSSGTNNKWPSAGYVAGPKRQAAWRILDAQYFGVPQRRRRVFVIASARERFNPGKVFFERAGVSGDFESCCETGESSARESQDGVGSTNKRVMSQLANGNNIVGTLTASDFQKLNQQDNDKCVIEPNRVSVFPEGSFGTFREGTPCGTVKAAGGVLGGGSETLLVTEEKHESENL